MHHYFGAIAVCSLLVTSVGWVRADDFGIDPEFGKVEAMFAGVRQHIAAGRSQQALAEIKAIVDRESSRERPTVRAHRFLHTAGALAYRAKDYAAARGYLERALADADAEQIADRAKRKPGMAADLSNPPPIDISQTILGDLVEIAKAGGDRSAQAKFEKELKARIQQAFAPKMEGLDFGLSLPRTAPPRIGNAPTSDFPPQDLFDVPNVNTAAPRPSKPLPIERKSLTEAQQGELKETDERLTHCKQLKDAQKSADALPLAQRALETRQRLLGNGHPNTLEAMNIVGVLQTDLGKFDLARETLTRAMAEGKQHLPDEHPLRAFALHEMGGLCVALGDYPSARRHFVETLRILNAATTEDLPLKAVATNSLAHVLQAQGEYGAARELYERALRTLQEKSGRDHPDTALLLSNYAESLVKLGDLATAKGHHEQALAIRRKTLGQEHPDVAASLNNLGALHELLGQYPLASEYYQQALKIFLKAHGKEHPATVTSVSNLGKVLLKNKDYKTVLPMFEEVVRIRRQNHGERHPDTADALINLSLVYEETGDTEKSRVLCDEALDIRRGLLGESHPLTLNALNRMAQLYASAGDWRMATRFADQGRRGAHKHLVGVLPSLSEQEQLVFLNQNHVSDFSLALSIALANRQQLELVEKSASWLANGKGVAQESLAHRNLLTRDLKNPRRGAIVAELLSTRQQLAALSMSIPEPGKASARDKRLGELLQTEQRLSRQIRSDSGDEGETPGWVQLEQIRSRLAADAVFIDIARFQPFNFQAGESRQTWSPARYAAWIIPPVGKGDVKLVDLGQADVLDLSLGELRDELQSAASAAGVVQQLGEPEAERKVQALFQELSQQIWHPISRHLGAAKQVVLCPDGALWLLPWAALPVDAGKYLLETHSLRLVTSGRDLIRQNDSHEPQAPVIVANPKFDQTAAEKQVAIQAIFKRPTAANANAARFVGGSILPRVSPLPGTAAEAAAIHPSVAKLSRQPPILYSDGYALESVAKALVRPRLAVFATHGFFLPPPVAQQDSPGAKAANFDGTEAKARPIANPLLRCGLLLAGCNQPTSASDDDGILTGMEIVGIDLRGTDLVVLSACETAIGDVRSGEGVAGLRQAFQLAGAHAVTASLWQVPDQDTALIMNDFFANLAEGQSKADALRNAQLKRIASRRDKFDAAHPFYWAAWTVTGN